MPDRVSDAPIVDSRADRLNRYLLNPHDHLLDKSPYGDLVMFTEAAAAIRVLEGKVARLEAEKQDVRTEAWNAGLEAAAKECDQFVEAYSFWGPFPEGYVYGDNESRAAALFARGRFEVAAKIIREASKATAAKQGGAS